MSRPHPAGPRHGDVVATTVPYAPPPGAGSIDPAIWPAGTVRTPGGELSIDGFALTDIAGTYGTPVLVMAADDLVARASAYAEAFAGCDVYYAGKAFLASAVVRWVRDAGLGLDVCSAGELTCALAAGMPPERILLHGNNKSDEELMMALDAGVGRIVVDSFGELRRLSAIAADRALVAPVLVRITLGVEAHTHEFIATAHEDQKFGFSLASGSARSAVLDVVANPNLRLVGVHSHIGSQIFVSSGFEVAAHRAVRFLADMRTDDGIEIAELNLGGGLGIKYVADDRPIDVRDIAPELRAIVNRECQGAGISPPRLAFEPGRAIVGPTTLTLYEVGTVKPRTLEGGQRRVYVSVDGGMSDNIRTALYDADYTVVLANRDSAAEPVLCRIVGIHCESGDIVVRDAWLPGDIGVGDLLAVAATGAYNRSMASNYNLVPRPPVIAVRDGAIVEVLRRETLADLFATDPGFAPDAPPVPASEANRT